MNIHLVRVTLISGLLWHHSLNLYWIRYKIFRAYLLILKHKKFLKVEYTCNLAVSSSFSQNKPGKYEKLTVLAGIFEHCFNLYLQYAAYLPPWSKPPKFFPESPSVYPFFCHFCPITDVHNSEIISSPKSLSCEICIQFTKFLFYPKN